MITVSVVSHQQAGLLASLLPQLLVLPLVSKVVVTLNVPEVVKLPQSDRIKIVTNKMPKGFGANHNHAFQEADTPYFCVINPDIKFEKDPFPWLTTRFESGVFGIVCPMVRDSVGKMQNSVREFPTITDLALKIFGRETSISLQHDVSIQNVPWCAGMFMLFKSSSYKAVGGFDESFFLYYEDVDMCARMWAQGFSVGLVPKAEVIHDAQRDSHRRLDYLALHLKSLALYLCRYKLGFATPRVLA